MRNLNNRWPEQQTNVQTLSEKKFENHHVLFKSIHIYFSFSLQKVFFNTISSFPDFKGCRGEETGKPFYVTTVKLFEICFGYCCTATALFFKCIALKSVCECWEFYMQCWMGMHIANLFCTFPDSAVYCLEAGTWCRFQVFGCTLSGPT